MSGLIGRDWGTSSLRARDGSDVHIVPGLCDP